MISTTAYDARVSRPDVFPGRLACSAETNLPGQKSAPVVRIAGGGKPRLCDLRASNTRRRWLPRADSGRTESAQLCAVPLESRNTKDGAKSAFFRFRHFRGSGGARGAQAHIGGSRADSNRIVWISSKRQLMTRSMCGPSDRSAENTYH